MQPKTFDQAAFDSMLINAAPTLTSSETYVINPNYGYSTSMAAPPSINTLSPETIAKISEGLLNLGGVKHDSGKPGMSLLSREALEQIALVMDFGKEKYAAHNWRNGFAWSRPLSAAIRHIMAFNDGEDKDPESGLSHLAHAACCIMFLLEFEKTHKELDDRWKPAEKANN
jgi:hypothetical protein